MASPMFPLVEDVIGRILTFCPDFATLHAVVLASKQFHAVYQTHPKSITQAVAYNIVGPALPAALRVLRYPSRDINEDSSDPLTVTSVCVEESSASIITWDEKMQLVKNAEEIAVLEDIYSIKFKSRHSRTSVLTPEESHRFQRAAYRAELFSAIFPADTWSVDDIDELDSVAISNIQEQRAALLNVYDTRELLELFSFVRFMRAILKGIVAAERHIDILLTAGPTRILEAWEDDIGWDSSNADTPNRLFDGYYARAFAKHKDILNPPTEDDGGSAARWLLSDVPEVNDTCSHCLTRGGLELLTEANWHLHPISQRSLGRLKSRLTNNSTLFDPVNKAVAVAGTTAVRLVDVDFTPRGPSLFIFWGGWISAVFDFAQTAGQSEFASWTKDQSYCVPCLGRFLDENVWRWLLAERVKEGWVPPEDCWYGYNCRTQVHKYTHATTKNHLAVPTRGDE
ncbi:hypothetical protein FB45DRAFT_899901 [Roridomyces roridus]|uniref:Aprataxin and PNK-like factor PBZ domain-containing protein n=1 Tax=Roridomyces roridus TaxID=1738132 RepID=A0AAD7C7K2_9AGAR|nr:hypothetical protein FB45DRAFT_899901 [Roridomyces roridus]